jgi:hypothetical protein
VNRDHDLARLALDRDVGDRRVPQPRLEVLAQQFILAEQCREIPVRVPARPPLLGDAEAEAQWIDLLSH